MIPDPTLIYQLEKALPAYIVRCRWFRSKALTISQLAVSHIIEADGFLVLFITIHFAEGGTDFYLLPIASVLSPNVEQQQEEPIIILETPDGGRIFVYDAVFSPFFRDVLFRTLANGGQFESDGNKLTAQSSMTPPPVEGIVQSSVSRAQQSNTSIIYGKQFIAKLFRKLEPGINPDIEIGAFLTAQGFTNTPAMLATLVFEHGQGETMAAAILQSFVPNEGDAWKYTLQSLAAFYHRALDTKLDNPELLGDYVASAKLLGVRTAQMHVALASSASSPDFAPERFSEPDALALSKDIVHQAETSFALLQSQLAVLPPEEQLLARQVLQLEVEIGKRLNALSAIRTSAKRIRYHGDYHLGQVLYTGSDFMIIDFEGEPARPLSERRAKALALRDVAGMLRSFQYAAYAGPQGLIPDLPATPAMQTKLADCSAFWYSQASRLFLDAYFAEANSRDFLPSTPDQRTFFLDAFLLQKALYEVQYELNNRPAWVGIPLRGIISLLQS